MKGGRAIAFTFLNCLLSGCVYHEVQPPVICSDQLATISLVSSLSVTDCLARNGLIEVIAVGNNPPYEYSIDQQVFQPVGLFDSLAGGEYIILVRDKNNCRISQTFILPDYSTDLAAEIALTPDSDCETENGKININPIGGEAPYSIAFQDISSDQGTFEGLSPGAYQIEISDAKNCMVSYTVELPRAVTGISWRDEIKPIMDTRCAKSGCHVKGSGRVDFTIFNNIVESAALIKLYTQTLRMPQDGVLPEDQIKKIACWVDDGTPNN